MSSHHSPQDAQRSKWNARFRKGDHTGGEPSLLLVRVADHLPQQGRALDVAGGAGRHAIWLAQRGLQTSLVDISSVGLELARRRAKAANLSIETIERDLETEPFPEGKWDMILSCCYLWRPLFPVYREALNPGGLLIVLQPTKSNLLKHSKPPAEYLLEDGELPSLVKPLNILVYDEGWLEEGRHDALIIAQKPP